MSCISLHKLEPDKLTTPFESAYQFTLACTVSDSKTVPGCHYNFCSERFSHSLDTLYPCCTLTCAFCNRGQRHISLFGDWSPSLTAALEFDSGCFFSSRHHSKFSLTHAQQVCFTQYPRPCVTPRGCSRSHGQDTSRLCGQYTSLCCLAFFNALTEF